MRDARSFFRVLSCPVLVLILLAAITRIRADDGEQTKEQFVHPTRDYATAPLWVWNDLLTEQQIRQTLRDLAGQEVKQAFVHPRPGLMTPYLSDDWFRLWAAALDEAKSLDMNLWIYDENSYPSGFAGGWVPEQMPEARGRGLRWEEVTSPGPWQDSLLGVYALTDQSFEDRTEQARTGNELPPGRYLVVHVDRAPDADWTANRCYVDLLHPGVTEKFIDVTMEAYRKHFGDQFGNRIPGWFTDEPHLSPFGATHWSEHLPEAFRARWGYDLVSNLPCLRYPVGDWRRVRHNYYQLLLEQFIERWAKPCFEYCEQHQLEFTGHYWEHGWPGAGHGSDNMAMYAWHQRPAIDNLMNQYSEDVNGQFGNSRTVKELSSVANQMGRQRTLCEAYGAGGWELRFEDMKRIGDWLYVLGVNTLDEHLSYITIRGTRKRDHPQSFSYHEPWWRDYHVMARYFTRLSVAMSQGEQRNEILVIEPTTTAWMYQPDPSTGQRLRTLGQSFQDLVNRLEAEQVEYDLGSEDILARHGSISTTGPDAKEMPTPSAWFVVGKRSYHTVVLPAHTENLNRPTVDLLEKFADAGGRILYLGAAPEFVDGMASDSLKENVRQPAWQLVEASELAPLLRQRSRDGFGIERDKGDQGILFHHRRQLTDGQWLLLVNTSMEQPSAGTVHTRQQSVERWCPFTGTAEPYAFSQSGDGVSFSFRLPPCGSLLLWLSAESKESPVVERTTETLLTPASDVVVERRDPNVLTLDFLDLTVGDQTQSSIYCYQAARRAFQHYGWPKNPWDHAVQFRDEILRREFPQDSGFRAVYRFRIEAAVPDDLAAVVERPDLYRITCNGRSVAPTSGQWWLDRAFGKIDLTGSARIGDNELVLDAAPMTIFHEIESVYILGDFSLQPTESGFTIQPATPLRLGSWKDQGMPLFGHTVAYTVAYEVDQPAGSYRVRLPEWLGSVAEVVVNGQLAGHMVSQPWEVDVTPQIQPGRNEVEIRVIGTLKNTLGPHHGQPVLGSAWPGNFYQAPESGPPAGSQYHTVDYGLFAAPQLLQIR